MNPNTPFSAGGYSSAPRQWVTGVHILVAFLHNGLQISDPGPLPPPYGRTDEVSFYFGVGERMPYVYCMSS